MKGRRFVPMDVDCMDNPKIQEVGYKAELLYLRGLQLAKRLHSDGAITDTQVVRTLGKDLPAPRTLAGKLVAVGLWTREPKGYRVVGWLERNTSAADLDQWRDSNAERQRRHRRVTRDSDPPVTRDIAVSNATEEEEEEEEEPPPRFQSDLRGPSANGAGLTAGEEEDSGRKSRSKDQDPGPTDSPEQHLRRTCLVIAARRLVARPATAEPIRRPELWQSEVAREAVERFREAHHSIFSDSVSLLGRPPTEQEMASALEPAPVPTGMAAIDATAAEDP